LPDGKTSGIELGGCVAFVATIDGESVSRKYTPISDINQRGTVDFVIKVYRPTVDFP
jgi:Oxidoreductase FAD-binding domain